MITDCTTKTSLLPATGIGLRRLAVSSLLGLFALPAAAAAALPESETTCQPLPKTELRLCVRNLPERSALWSLFPGGPVAIPTTGSTVYDFSISPGGEWLALVTADEGHPILDLVDIRGLPRGNTPRLQTSINPYPGALWLLDWNGSRLQLGSSVPLDQPPAVIADNPFEYLYRLDAGSGKLLCLAISATAPEPITFPASYDATDRQWHCNCQLAENTRRRATDNLAYLHRTLAAGRILLLDVATGPALNGGPATDACVANLLAALKPPDDMPVEIRSRMETLPETTGVQIEMKLVNRLQPE